MKKVNSLKVKLTIGVGMTFLAMIITLTLFSIIGINQLFVVPVQEVIPAALVPAGNEITESIEAQRTIDATKINATINIAQYRFNLLAFLSMIIIGCGGTLLTYLFIRKTVKPLDEFSNEIARIDEKVMNQPPLIDSSITEIKQLSDSFNKMLERLNQSFESQKMFSTAAAHELKTPLAIIKANIDVLEMDNSNSIEEYQTVVNVTKRQLNRMTELIDNLFLVSSLESYEFNDKISLVKMIKNITQDIEFKLKEKNISLSINCEDKIIVGNETMLTRAFVNLIDNSIKYASTDNPYIKIYTETKDGYCLVIEDNGIGIEDKDLANIFEPFYRADKSRSRKIAGSGLGLSITKDIIEAHHSEILISSELGKGTKIIIKFN